MGAVKHRRPRLTAKRVEGLQVIADAYSQLMFNLSTPSERKKANTAVKFIRDLKEWKSKCQKESHSD
jgi:hypothetical protein